jgi:hypothetical protein
VQAWPIPAHFALSRVYLCSVALAVCLGVCFVVTALLQWCGQLQHADQAQKAVLLLSVQMLLLCKEMLRMTY